MKISKLWPCPKDMGIHGRRFWRNVGPILVESGSLDQLDRQTFEVLCRSYHKMLVIDNTLEESGLSVDDARGSSKKSPMFTQWRAYADLYVKLLSHFGLSPLARGMKVRPAEEPNANGKDRFFQKQYELFT